MIRARKEKKSGRSKNAQFYSLSPHAKAHSISYIPIFLLPQKKPYTNFFIYSLPQNPL